MRSFIILSFVAVLFSVCTAAPKDRQNDGVSEDDKQAIVAKLNELRRKVAKGEESRGSSGPQPPASNMRQMSWDDDLAKAAQILAERCDFEHDTDIPAGSKNGYGQNLAQGSGTWPEMVQYWYDEVDQFDSSAIKPYKYRDEIGHYTAVVWAESSQVGCGVSSCSGSPVFACNFWEGGNVGGGEMYKSGEAGSACPEGTSPDDGLCA